MDKNNNPKPTLLTNEADTDTLHISATPKLNAGSSSTTQKSTTVTTQSAPVTVPETGYVSPYLNPEAAQKEPVVAPTITPQPTTEPKVTPAPFQPKPEVKYIEVEKIKKVRGSILGNIFRKIFNCVGCLLLIISLAIVIFVVKINF